MIDKYRLALSQAPMFGAVTRAKLLGLKIDELRTERSDLNWQPATEWELGKFAPKVGADLIWRSDFQELLNFLGDDAKGRTKLGKFCEWRKEYNLDAAWEEFCKLGITVILFEDQSYPRWLREIFDPPTELFCLGKLPEHLQPMISVVGARAATEYGVMVTKKIVSGLVESGFGIVSGLADGIDATAHKAAIVKRGITVAVLGCGHSQVKSEDKSGLVSEILEAGGAVISEFPPSLPPATWTYPVRNRIIAGLTQATVVIEAKLGSGTLITANSALESDREVMAVPGSVLNKNSEGCHKLIKEGAWLVECTEDILGILEGEYEATPHGDNPLPNPPHSKAPTNQIKRRSVSARMIKSGVTSRNPATLSPVAQLIWSLFEQEEELSFELISEKVSKSRPIANLGSESKSNLMSISSPELLVALTELELLGWLVASPVGFRKN